MFSHKETVQQTFVERNRNLLEKIAKSRFVPPFGGLSSNVHSSSMACWKARGRQLSLLWRYEQILVNDSWRQKTRFPGLSRGVVCVILCLAVLIQYRCVTYRQTDKR